MLERARKKLREAQFFLTAAYQEEQTILFEKTPDALEFYLSAFVSAGRSVTFAMSKDAGESTEEWTVDWITRLPSADDRKLMKFFNTQRINTVHKGTLDLKEVVVTVSYAEFTRELIMGGAATSFVTSPPSTPQSSVNRTELKFKGLADGSAIAYCRRYIDLVATFIADFEHGHPKPKSTLIRKLRRVMRTVRNRARRCFQM